MGEGLKDQLRTENMGEGLKVQLRTENMVKV